MGVNKKMVEIKKSNYGSQGRTDGCGRKDGKVGADIGTWEIKMDYGSESVDGRW